MPSGGTTLRCDMRLDGLVKPTRPRPCGRWMNSGDLCSPPHDSSTSPVPCAGHVLSKYLAALFPPAPAMPVLRRSRNTAKALGGRLYYSDQISPEVEGRAD